MSFLSKEPFTFINIKLTDTGRRLLSLGRLTFDKAALSDREINYNIDDGITNPYNIKNNRVLAPKDDHPFFNNLDGSDFVELAERNVGSVKQIVSASTTPAGFFTGSTNNFALDPDKFISELTITYSGAGTPTGSTSIGYDAGSPSPADPKPGQLIYIPWEPIQNSGKTHASDTKLASGNPTVRLWYRIKSADTSNNVLSLDRPVPNFGEDTNQTINAYTYPFNGVEDFYGSGLTQNVNVWNMNIIRTSSVIGTNSNISGFTTYGSIEYNGIKTYLGFSSETRQVGVVHFTNKFTGNTYAEQFVEKTFRLDIPNIMWHKTNANVGEAKEYGISLFDKAGDTTFDDASQTTFRELKDGTSKNNRTVGRVYHKLKIVVITDPELLTALTYKSNRNFTLPRPQLELKSSPKPPLTTNQATGLINTGKTYFVTYLVDSDRPYSSGSTFGYPKPLHCNYISQIEGEVDNDGNKQFLSVTFPNNSFPYMRKESNMSVNSSFSGTGWNANKVQLLVSEQDKSDNLRIDDIPTDEWRLISSGKTGNGVYSGETGDSTIDPVKLQSFQFVISQEDYNSGSTYTLDSVFHQNNDITESGLTFGNESFFFGKLSTDIRATSFKSTITVLADNQRFNSSSNPTFDQTRDQDTYITEIGILNQDDQLVAVGKPTFPIKKNSGRFLGFKLEMDF